MLLRWALSVVIWSCLPLTLGGADSSVPSSRCLGIRPGNEQDLEAERFFDGPVVQFDIRLSPENQQKLRDNPREYVAADVSVEGQTLGQVGIHVKGAAGSLDNIDGKPALTLNFDKFRKKQLFRGLEKIHLNNSVQDPSYLNESVASGLYRKMGLPTARATHALLRLDGRDCGLYVVKEGYDSLFLKRHFPADSKKMGNLYDGGFLRDVTEPLDRNAGDGPEDHSDLQRLVEAAESPLKDRRGRLEKVLDIDRFLTLVAIQILTDDWDGYSRNHNNYRLYLPRDGQAVFIPHGMDQLFQKPQASITPALNGLVAARVVEIPGLRDRVRERLSSLTTQHFNSNSLSSDLDRIVTRLRRGLERLGEDERRSVEEEIRQQSDRMLRRIRSVERQLQRGTGIDTTGSIRVSPEDWEERHQEGKAAIRMGSLEVVPPALLLEALEPGTIVSYRTEVPLETGSYTLWVDARVDSVEGVFGAVLRISGQQRVRGLTGTRDWTRIRFDVDQEDAGDIQVVLELAADAGRVWFDLGSLRIQPR
jgi:hypothetical protein